MRRFDCKLRYMLASHRSPLWRRTPGRAPSLVSTLAAWVALILANGSHAESQLVFPYPTDLGIVPAASYDAKGAPVGGANIHFEQLDDGLLRLRVTMGVDGGARNEVEADFEVLGDKQGLQLVRESSRSHDDAGGSLGILEIDHTDGVARCVAPGAPPSQAAVLPLPANDRVANVPMNILFMPLIRGEVDQIKFQVFLCRGGPRFMDFVALRTGKPTEIDSHDVVEVRYGPDLGRILSWAASRLAPKLSFWFDAESGQYLAHRAPLYSKGPEVTVVRDGVSPPIISR